MDNEQRIKEILAEVRPLAAEYNQITGKSLGITGEVADTLQRPYWGWKWFSVS
jgi:hypothetical protein